MHYFDRFPMHRQWPLGPRALHLPDLGLLDHDTPVVNLGSCFGENLQLFLDMYDFDAFETQCGYKYSCHSILREVKNALDGRLTTADHVFTGEMGYTDLNHHRIYDQDKENYLRKINRIERNVQTALAQAKVVALTPSVNEVWFNRKTGEYILHPYPGVLGDESCLEVNFLTVAENLQHLEEIRDLLLVFNPDMQIIVNVCPTSLRVTYQDMDAVQGNNASKFTIYAAVNEFAQRHANVHYFPGFDIVFSELAERRHYTDDNRHLNQPAIRHYLRRFCEMFCTERSRRIVGLLEDLETGQVSERFDHLRELAALGYDADLLRIKTANAHLLGGDPKAAFDALCRVSLLRQSPACCLNLGLMLRDMGLDSKAAGFFARTLELLEDIPGLAFAMADRRQRVRLGDNHMMTCGNISNVRQRILTRMRDQALALLRTPAAGTTQPLRKLVFMDGFQHTLFPIGMAEARRSGAAPVGHPREMASAAGGCAADHCGEGVSL